MKRLTLLLNLFIPIFSFSQIINIPDDYPTIQEGIDAAGTGDTVLVDTGTYIENINFNGKNITVASNYLFTLDKSYISNTIINGNQNGSVVKFESDEDTTAILTGFTITEGFDSDGGGIFVDSASPKLEYLNIHFNEVEGSGGGMYFNNSNSKLYNIIVKNNISNHGWTYYMGGGGIYSCMSNLNMDSLVVQNNNGWVGGGIKFDEGSNVTIKNSHILGNTVLSGFSAGGGLCLYYSTVNLENVLIADNSASTPCTPSASGGGIDCSGSTLAMSGVTIRNNEADWAAGGISFSRSDLLFDTIYKCSIYSNKAPVGHDISGGGREGMPEIILDTFSVTYPTDYYIVLSKFYNFDISHGLVEQLDADLYVSANGNNFNSGLTEEYPLLNIQHALSILRVDSLHPHTIHVQEGIYSPSNTQEYFPINIPDYCRIIGLNPTTVILNAEQTGSVINITGNSETQVSGLTITGGFGGFTSGGISCGGSNPLLSNLIIRSNTAFNPAISTGGGLLLGNSDPELINVLIANNNAWSGGGVYLNNSNPVFTNCTFSGNSGNSGRGIYITGNSNVILKNTIMWSDSLGEIRIFNDDTIYASLSIAWSDIHGGLEGIVAGETGTVYWLEGNINEDPQFDIGGNHPYALTNQSPCIDTGTPDTTELNLPIGDIIGNQRFWDGDNNETAIIDMGAYEYGSVPVYIDKPISTKLFDETGLKTFPNPFSQSTTIEYQLDKPSEVTITIFNHLGKQVDFIQQNQSQGKQQVSWDATGQPPGVYYFRMKAGEQVATGKLLLVR